MKKKNKILLGASAVLAGAVTAAVTSYALTKNLVKIALDREEPKLYKKAKNRISGNENTKEILEQIEVLSKQFVMQPLETVEIVARDGEKLTGHFYKNQNAKRIIIAMHGWRSSWAKDFCAIYEFWHNNDCSVLYVEQRGQGQSGGDYMGFGMIERFDCADWADYVNREISCDLPIYLAGVSMGAATVLMASALDLPYNVKGIIADCGFTSADEIWKHVVNNNMRLSYTMFSSIADDLCKKCINIGSKEYSTLEALNNTDIPVLFIHGSDDSFVPVEMTYENYKACKSEKRLLIVPGAEHGMSYVVDKPSYETTVLNFFKDFD